MNKNVNGMYILKALLGNTHCANDLRMLMQRVYEADRMYTKELAKTYPEIDAKFIDAHAMYIAWSHKDELVHPSRYVHPFFSLVNDNNIQAITTIYMMGYYDRNGRNSAVIERLERGDITALFDDLEATWYEVARWTPENNYNKLYWIDKNPRFCAERIKIGIEMIEEYRAALCKKYSGLEMSDFPNHARTIYCYFQEIKPGY